MEYGSGMRVKTSVTLSEESLRAIDQLAGRNGNRSQIIEQAVREYVEHRRRLRRDARDLEILNRAAQRLNREMEDVLGYQADG